MEQDEGGIDTSRCFVPEILIDLLTKQISKGNAKTSPTSYILHGVCLLVDISGFTKLSFDLCAEGKVGIDGLQLVTNGYMGKLVEIIYLFGGDIIKFAGDAILCIFPTALVTKLVKTKRGILIRRSMSPDSELLVNARDGVASYIDCIRPIGTSGKEDSFKSHASLGSGSLQNENVIRPDLLLRAMHCAESLKKITFETLTVHVAISCGELYFGVLGGYENRWECLISGPCLQELSGCLDDAPSMQAVMTAGCLEILRRNQRNLCLISSIPSPIENINDFLGYKYTLTLLDSGNATICSVAAEESDGVPQCTTGSAPVNPKRRIQDDCLAGLVMQYVPTIVVSGIRQGTGLSYISEIREVTTMFMKWDSYDVTDKHRDLIELQDCFYRAQKILHYTGAYLRQFLVDDKGCVLIACWGMPSQTYLDNAHRALTSAVEIRAALLQLQMTCSFGITTGDVYCGTVGSALRMEYAAIGIVVNMAARLMGKAHGSILIDEATYLHLPVQVQGSLTKLPPMQVKGCVEPIDVYQHTGKITLVSARAGMADSSADGVLELRDCCREPLTSLLQRLGGGHSSRRRSSAMNMLLNTFGSLTPPVTPRKTSCTTISSVLVEGKKGMGCKASTAWLYKQAQERSICTAFVKVADKAYLCPFHVLYKIFALCAPKDLYRSDTCQRQYVHALLKEVYPDDADMATHVAFPIMKQALSITCAYDRECYRQGSDKSSSSKSQGYLLRSAAAKEPDGKFPVQMLTSVLTTIFRHLLTERTVLVIIDDIHNSDEESLRVLVELLKIDSRSAIVMTAEIPGAHGPNEKVDKAQTEGDLTQDAVDGKKGCSGVSGGWASTRALIVNNHHTVVVAVDVFTVAEIAAMLAALPESASFPPHLPALVQTLSGGEFAVVNEIIRFVREFGAPQLLSVVGEQAPHTPEGRPLSPRRTPPNVSPRQSFSSRKSGTPPPERSPRNSLRTVRGNSGVKPALDSAITAAADSSVHREGFKIDQLVVCRYEKLRLSTKQILRTASIIGRTFSRQVLYGVLPRSLKGEVTSCLHTLVRHQWIQQSDGDAELYEFRYEYSHQVIYNITPESERRNLHKVIADYIEEISAGDAAQSLQLCYHYGKCNTVKALLYTGTAASYLLESNAPLDLCECVDLLFAAVPHCTTMQDVEALQSLAERAMSKTREYKAPAKRRPLRRFFSLCCVCSSNAVAPNAHDANSPDEMDAHWNSDSGDVQSLAVLSQNDLSRSYFLTLLGQLESALDQRNLEILCTPTLDLGKRSKTPAVHTT